LPSQRRADARHLGRVLPVLSAPEQLKGIWEAKLGKDHPSVADTLNNLATTGQQGRSFEGQQTDTIGQVAFTPDGKVLASADTRKVHLWDVATGRLLRSIPGNLISHETIVAFLPDGQLIAQQRDYLGIYDVSSGKEVRRLPLQGGFHAMSRNGKKLATVHYHRLHVWETDSGRESFSFVGHQDSITSLAVAPSGKVLATASMDHTFRLWELPSGRELRSPGQGLYPVEAVQFSPDGRYLAAVTHGGKKVGIWNTAGTKLLQQIEASQLQFTGCAFAPDSKALALGVLGQSRSVQMWDPATGKLLRTVGSSGPEEGWTGVTCVAFSPDGRFVAAGVMDFVSNIRVWDLATGKEHCQMREPITDKEEPIGRPILGVCSLAFSADGRQLVSASRKGRVWLWDVVSAKPLQRLDDEAERPFVPWDSHLALSRDGKTLAVAGSDGIQLLETATRKRRRMVPAKGSAKVAAFSPDGRFLTTAGNDATALVWDLLRLAHGGLAPAGELTMAEQETVWQDLASEDAAKAYGVIGRLAAAEPSLGVASLRERLRPATPADAKLVKQWIAELDSPQFAVRQKATDQLLALDNQVQPALEQARMSQPTLEVRQRLDQILGRITAKQMTSETLRNWRAIEVLELIGTLQAKTLLEQMAQRAPEALVTREAEAALQRLKRRETP